MQPYEQKFDNALSYLLRPELLNPSGDRPICYVIYEAADARDVYYMIDTMLRPKAAYYGFQMHEFSLGKALQEFIATHSYRDDWADDDFSEQELYDSIRCEVTESQCLATRLLDYQEAITDPKPLLVIKDLELLHPFDKMGRIEQLIYNRIRIPMLVLYPGEATGTARTYLNIYPMDGNYRSKNF